MKINIDQLTLSYGSEQALKDISITLNKRKIYGLLGRNGAGKTSLLSIIGSFREATSGKITINSEYPFENPKIMQSVNFIYNKDYKDESSSVEKIINNVQAYRPNFDHDYAAYLINLFQLPTDQPVKKLSKGMKSTLNVILGLAARCPVTIFDEVYLGMDAPSRDIFYKQLLEDQQKYPRMFILSTHLIAEMDYLFDEILVLHEGEILLQASSHKLHEIGTSIMGRKNTVNKFTQSKQLINIERLGEIKSVTILGNLTEDEYKEALTKGLEVSYVSLNDLFIQLTKEAK